LGFEQGTNDAVGEEHAATTEITDKIERWYRASVIAANVGKGTAQRDVVDVMTRSLCVWACLTPPGHPAEDEFRVSLHAHLGPYTESLHHARPETLDQRIGLGHEVEECLDAVGILQVEGDIPPISLQHVTHWFGGDPSNRLGSIHSDDFSTHVGQHHRCEWSGSDSGDLDDSVSAQWS
jgi:hypothetical protein